MLYFYAIRRNISPQRGPYFMTRLWEAGRWPHYTYIVPQIYTQAKVRLIGLGNYVPRGTITNDFFAYISTRLGDPRSADDLERVTGLTTRYVRASTLELCRRMAGDDAPGLIDDPGTPKDETLVDMAVIAAERAIASAGRNTSEINGSDANQASSLYFQTPLRKDVLEMAEVDMKIQQLFREGKGKELKAVLSQDLIGYTKMKGKEVFREAPRAMAESVDVLCRHAQLSPDELSHIVPHQANSRITKRLGELLINDYGWPRSTMGKLADNFRCYGNLSNASIATSLVELLRQDKLHEGQWMALPAVGGGMNYGCWLLRFHALKNLDAVLNPA